MSQEIERNIPIQENEWYSYFVEEARAIIVETGENSRMELIKGKWLLGKLVVEKEELFKRAGYGERIIETVAEDIGMSASHLWKCVQFYKKFPQTEFDEVENELPEGKNISWYKIYTQYLPESKSDEDKARKLREKQENCSHSILRCANCRMEFNGRNLLGN